jgi:hypothetical protein
LESISWNQKSGLKECIGFEAVVGINEQKEKVDHG